MGEGWGQLTFRWGGVTATCQPGADERHYRLCTLSNSSAQAATITVRLEGQATACFELRPFEKRVVYPPLVVEKVGTF